MPRHYLKRVLPSHASVKERWFLRPLGAVLHDPALMALHRKAVVRAFAIGLFFGMMPLPGQTVLAGLLAIWVRCNIPVALVSVWVTNPVTMGPIFFGEYLLGAQLLHLPVGAFEVELTFRWLSEGFLRVWKPLMLGAVIFGGVASVLGYFTLNAIWQFNVAQRWKRRAAADSS